MIFIWIVFVFIACLLFQCLRGDSSVDSLLSQSSQLKITKLHYQNGLVDFDSTINQVHKFKPTAPFTTLLQTMDSFETRLYNLVVFTITPNSVQQDFSSEWIGPEDGTAAPGPDYSIWSSTSPLANWHSNANLVSDYSLRVLQMCKSFSNDHDPFYLNSTLGKHIMSAYLTFFQAIEDWTFEANTFPWGQDWYPFTVTGSIQLAYGIFHLYTIGKDFHSQIADLKSKYCKFVEKVYESPVKALGWSRTGVNILLQAAPYLIGHYWLNDIDQMKTEHQADFDKLMQFDFVMVTDGDGLRPDYGWIRSDIRDYGQLANTNTAAMIINLWYPYDYGDLYNTVSKIMCHPEINANMPGLFSRTAVVKRQLGIGAYGVQIQYSDRIVNVKQKTFFMQFFGQLESLACYEADAINNTCFPLWATLREMWVVGDTIRQYNPDSTTGNIHYSPGNFMYGEEVPFVWKPTTTGNDSLKPFNSLSGSIIDDGTVLFYQTYQVRGYCQGIPITEFEIIDEDCRFALYFSAVGKGAEESLNQFIHVAEIGVVKRKIDENTWLFANGKVLQVLTSGEIITREVTYDHGLASDPLTTTPVVETVILTKYEPTNLPDSDTALGGVMSYKVYSTLDAYNNKSKTEYKFFAKYINNLWLTFYLKYGDRIFICPQTKQGSNLIFYTTDLKRCFVQDFEDTLSSRSMFYATECNRLTNNHVFIIPKYDTKRGYLTDTFTTSSRVLKTSAYDNQFYTGDYVFQLDCEARNLSKENDGVEAQIDFDNYTPNVASFMVDGVENDLAFGKMLKVPKNFLGASFGIPVDFSDPTQLMPGNINSASKEMEAIRTAADRDTEIPRDDWQSFEKTTIKSKNKIQVLEPRPSKLQFNYSAMPLTVQPKILQAQSQFDTTLSVLFRGKNFWFYKPADENVLYKNKVKRPYVFVKNPPLDLNNQRPSGKVVALPQIMSQL